MYITQMKNRNYCESLSRISFRVIGVAYNRRMYHCTSVCNTCKAEHVFFFSFSGLFGAMTKLAGSPHFECPSSVILFKQLWYIPHKGKYVC